MDSPEILHRKVIKKGLYVHSLIEVRDSRIIIAAPGFATYSESFTSSTS